MSNRDKILILMPTLYVGGSELQVRHIIDGLEKNNKNVIVLIENGSPADEQNMKYVSLHPRVEFVFLEQNTFHKNEKNLRNKISSLLCIMTWIIKNAKKKGIRWAMFTNLTGLITVPICRMLQIKVLFNERNPGIKMCDSFIKRTCLKMCNKIVANSVSASEYMSKCLGVNVECINNGVKVRENLAESAVEGNTILVPARVTRIKNQMVVAKAIKELGELKELKVLFAGQFEEQDYVDEIKTFIEQNKLKEKIQFLGYVKNVQELYDKARLIILPSFEEGTPNVMLEAYMNKKMCLASNIIMNKHVACDDRILFDVDNSVELAQKIRWILSLDENSKQELIQKNYNFVIENYSLEKMQKRYIEIFAE